ncbi:FAD-binding oxidoreductase [Biformimicrobium ophioploci]|uniref:FAD-binding oxidoreductase n=1 Tax=Biformimicrobium ophioploci TaxID=3036711 RepID=UPI002555A5B2|nr:FAD-binding oxidoreductase [Microbulbifer sp. NKW57]
MKFLVLLPLLVLGCAQASAVEIKPFTSDGCSAFPDGTLEQKELWLDCCRAHDYAYWKGGTFRQRLEADEALEACVAQTGEEEIALLMLAGVRVGGTPFLPTEFRWGYGWPFLRGYKALTQEELEAIRRSEAEIRTGWMSP